MFSKKEPAFQTVAISDHEGNGTAGETKRKFFTPVATRPSLLVALLCAILAFIALLQIAVSKSFNDGTTDSSLPTLNERQLLSIISTFSGSTTILSRTTETYTATTETESYGTYTFSAHTDTYGGATETFSPFTRTLYQLVTTVSGTLTTVDVELWTTDGVVSTVPVSQVSDAPPQSYIDTATPSSLETISGVPTTQSYLYTAPPSSPQTTSEAAPSQSYLDTSTTDTTVNVATISTAYLDPSTTPTNSALSPSATHVGVVDIAALPHTERVVSGAFTLPRYYVATYLCSLAVVLMKVLWGVVFSASKMVEPFYQLSRPGGAHASVSLLADYLSSGFSMATLSGVFTERPVMLMAIIVAAITTIMVPIASEAMSIKASALCTKPDGTTRRCAPVWIVNVPCIRLLQAILSLMVCSVMAYILLSLRRTSGIFSDPSSIASVGSLLGDRDFVEELRQVPADASTKDIKKFLGGNKYSLATFATESGNTAYGIVKVDHRGANGLYYSTDDRATLPTKLKKRFKKRKYLEDILLLLLSLGMLGVVLTYALDFKPDGFNNFFSSNTFGPRFVLSASATILDNRWKRLEREVRMMQPYRRLHSKHSSAKKSTKALLACTASTTYTSFPLALLRGDFFVALVSFVAVLGDALIIAVAGVPFSYGQVYSSFTVSTWLSVSILSLMIITTLVIMLFWRTGNPAGMPREPDTLVSVALYLCASQITENQQLVSLSMVGQEARDRVVKGWDTRYWFGKGVGVDGMVRWIVDRDEVVLNLQGDGLACDPRA